MLEYLKQHFEPYTSWPVDAEDTTTPLRCLSVDSRSSHIAWRVVEHATDRNIHMIYFTYKSTHLLQPLNVGCFSLMQTRYERNLSTWLCKNTFSSIYKLAILDILQQTRTRVFTNEMIQSRCSTAHCWPLECNIVPSPPPPPSRGMQGSFAASHFLDAAARVHMLSPQRQEIGRFELNAIERTTVYECGNLAVEKVTK